MIENLLGAVAGAGALVGKMVQVFDPTTLFFNRTERRNCTVVLFRHFQVGRIGIRYRLKYIVARGWSLWLSPPWLTLVDIDLYGYGLPPGVVDGQQVSLVDVRRWRVVSFTEERSLGRLFSLAKRRLV